MNHPTHSGFEGLPDAVQMLILSKLPAGDMHNPRGQRIGFTKPRTKTVRRFWTHMGAVKCACKAMRRGALLLEAEQRERLLAGTGERGRQAAFDRMREQSCDGANFLQLRQARIAQLRAEAAGLLV